MAMNYWLSFSPNTFLSSPDADCCMCYAMENDYEELAGETEAKEPQTVTVPLVEEFPRSLPGCPGGPGRIPTASLLNSQNPQPLYLRPGAPNAFHGKR